MVNGYIAYLEKRKNQHTKSYGNDGIGYYRSCFPPSGGLYRVNSIRELTLNKKYPVNLVNPVQKYLFKIESIPYCFPASQLYSFQAFPPFRFNQSSCKQRPSLLKF